ncbi:MAG TPA: DUF4410 domain-containing protein [Desulfomonilia bacterium]
MSKTLKTVLLALICGVLASTTPASASEAAVAQSSTCKDDAALMQDGDNKTKAIARPSIIYVTDFHLDPDQLQKESIIKRDGIVKKRLDALKPDDDPSQKAAKLIAALSGSIIKGLKDAGQNVDYCPNSSGLRKDFVPQDLNLPSDGWLVAGWFSKVDEGNRALSSTVGFGKGAESIQIEVDVYDLSEKSGGPFLHIGSESGAKKIPGGLITKNPYTMAAQYVLSKGATEKDVQKQGSAIAETLLQFINDKTGN